MYNNIVCKFSQNYFCFFKERWRHMSLTHNLSNCQNNIKRLYAIMRTNQQTWAKLKMMIWHFQAVAAILNSRGWLNNNNMVKFNDIPACIKPACIKPACIKPACIKPACIKPACIKPACIKPACIKPAYNWFLCTWLWGSGVWGGGGRGTGHGHFSRHLSHAWWATLGHYRRVAHVHINMKNAGWSQTTCTWQDV